MSFNIKVLANRNKKWTYMMRGVASGRWIFQPRMLAIVGYTSTDQQHSVRSVSSSLAMNASRPSAYLPGNNRYVRQ